MSVSGGVETHILNVTSVKQLVDLNKQLTNFKCQFHVESENKQPFEMIVINQRLLDKQEDIEFINVEDGVNSGEFVMDKNIYDNWFLVLRSKQPVKVFVKIDTEPLPDTIISEKEKINAVSINSIIKNTLLVILVGLIAYYIIYTTHSKKR